MSQTLQQALRDRIVIFDGAMGTEIYRRNFFVNISFENLCLARPDVIRAIHTAYLDAGAEVLTTNSSGANSCEKERDCAKSSARNTKTLTSFRQYKCLPIPKFREFPDWPDN